MSLPHPYLDTSGPIPIAHRGGAGAWPENTMPAFQGAVDLGFRYVETDVHATADGVLVAFHDDRLDRVTNAVGQISELRWSEVQEALVDGREPIPRFSELMSSFPDLRVNIDPKANSAVEPLIRELRELKALDRVCVGAFSDSRLRRIHQEFGDAVCLSMGPIEVIRARLSSWHFPTKQFRARAAQVPIRQGPIPIVDNRFVSRCHELGLAVHVWTIDEVHEMESLLDLGVDGIMTDVPATLLEVLRRRGLWPNEDHVHD
ncbi:MAG: glycerophosphodiester phosphodiesterase [Acidimicrobiales bacterium]|nr:glycerophosphodiester phosphodiesterase [Acidimicrobiales bacterium]